MRETYLGPRTIEECNEEIAIYQERMAKRPGSADRYQAHIDEALKVKGLLEAGAVFSIEEQAFVLQK